MLLAKPMPIAGDLRAILANVDRNRDAEIATRNRARPRQAWQAAEMVPSGADGERKVSQYH